MSRDGFFQRFFFLFGPFPLLFIVFPLPSHCRGKTGFAIAINLMYGMASLSSTFALLLVTESSLKSKHVQQVSGVYLSNFWFSALLWDLVNFLLPCLLMLVGRRSFLRILRILRMITERIMGFSVASGGVPGIRSGSFCGRQPPHRRSVVAASVRLGCGASDVPAQLPLLHCCHSLHAPHHLQHDLWHCHLFGRNHHDDPRLDTVFKKYCNSGEDSRSIPFSGS